MKIGPGVSELWGVENRPLPLTRPMAYTTACTTVQAVILAYKFVLCITCSYVLEN